MSASFLESVVERAADLAVLSRPMPNDDALAALRGRDTQLFLLGKEDVFVPPAGLAADNRRSRRR